MKYEFEKQNSLCRKLHPIFPVPKSVISNAMETPEGENGDQIRAGEPEQRLSIFISLELSRSQLLANFLNDC